MNVLFFTLRGILVDEGIVRIHLQEFIYSGAEIPASSVFRLLQVRLGSSFLRNVKASSIVLNEMVLEKQRSIFYQDPEIVTYNGPVVSAKTLQLPYANTTVKKDKSILHNRPSRNKSGNSTKC